MNIVFFNYDKQITNEFELIINPIQYGLHEVLWEDGGYSDFSDRYVILEENADFSTLSDEEFLQQYKEQAIMELAKLIERNRVFFLANGTLQEKETEFVNDKTLINSFTTEEELDLNLQQILPKYKL